MKENGNYGMTNRRKMNVLLGVLAGILFLLAAVGGGLYVKSQMKEKSYKASIKSAEKFLAQSDYEGAVLEYKKALKADPGKADTYVDLAEVYVEQEKTAEAKVVLKQGYQKTKSEKIQYMIEQLNKGAYMNTIPEEKEKMVQQVDVNTASQDITWNTSFVQKIVNFDYAAFKAEFGMGGIEMGDDGYLKVMHKDFDGTCYYANTSANKNIVDVSRKLPTDTGMPEKISLNSLDSIFQNFEGAVSLKRLQMMNGQTIIPKQEEDRTIIEIVADDLVMRIETDVDGNIVSPNAWNEIILVNANKGVEKSNYSGVVIDAVTGDGVEGAQVTFRASGKEDITETTKSDGTFSAELEAGNYEVVIEAEDYTEEEFEITIIKDRTYKGEKYTISPELAKGTARIVLEWGAQPRDLDSYLDGITDKGDSVFVSYWKRAAEVKGKVIADLDNDTTSGYGPETVTIHDLNGNYTFSVADYRRTQTMKDLGATVKVYLPGQQPVTIEIDPEGDVKDIWIVCEIDHGKLNVLNTAPETDLFRPDSK